MYITIETNAGHEVFAHELRRYNREGVAVNRIFFYNFAAESFHIKKLCSRLFSIKFSFIR